MAFSHFLLIHTLQVEVWRAENAPRVCVDCRLSNDTSPNLVLQYKAGTPSAHQWLSVSLS